MTEQEAKDRDATINEMVNALGRYATTFELQRAIYDAGWNAAIEHAAVKAETCEWVNVGSGAYTEYQTTCGDNRSPDFVPNYCENCGGKIVEKEAV